MPERPNGRYAGWGAPPGKPYRYRLFDRLADIYHGRRDGRKKIPRLIPPPEVSELGQDPTAPTEADVTSGAKPRHAASYLPPPETATLAEEHTIGTPQLLKLRSLARDLMSQERTHWLEDNVPKREQLVDIRAAIKQLTEVEKAAKDQLEAAAVKPTDEDLKERRIAEADPVKRPDRLVRDRRRAEFAGRQAEAEQAYADAVYRLTKAVQAELECQNAMSRRAAVARTRAHWIYEYAWRRTATYWQHLVRTHPHGAYLNTWLRPVGPELPRWAQDPPEDEGEPED